MLRDQIDIPDRTVLYLCRSISVISLCLRYALTMSLSISTVFPTPPVITLYIVHCTVPHIPPLPLPPRHRLMPSFVQLLFDPPRARQCFTAHDMMASLSCKENARGVDGIQFRIRITESCKHAVHSLLNPKYAIRCYFFVGFRRTDMYPSA